jgi:hypothetical protein
VFVAPSVFVDLVCERTEAIGAFSLLDHLCRESAIFLLEVRARWRRHSGNLRRRPDDPRLQLRAPALDQDAGQPFASAGKHGDLASVRQWLGCGALVLGFESSVLAGRIAVVKASNPPAGRSP